LDKKNCQIDALKYNSKIEFQKKSSGAYASARKNGWLNEIRQHMKRPQSYNFKWTKEYCIEEALKYKTRTEFQKKSGTAYNKAWKNNWLDSICSHMIKNGNKFNRCVYVYEFSDNCAYIGLTYNIKERNINRKSNDNDQVTKHIKITQLEPILKQLTDYIPVDEAAKLEIEYIQKYKDNNWDVLNKIKGGTIGGNNLKWTKELCQQEALKYKTRSEFQKKSGSAYVASRIKGWLNDISKHMIEMQKPMYYWTKEKCKIEALKYNSKIEFRKNSGGAYSAAQRKKWISEICKHMIEKRKPMYYWVKENCQIEALKYKSKWEFFKKSNGAYESSRKNGYLNDICQHMVEKQKPMYYWTKDKCKEESLKYKTKKEFNNNSGGAYKRAKINGWLDDISIHMINN